MSHGRARRRRIRCAASAAAAALCLPMLALAEGEASPSAGSDRPAADAAAGSAGPSRGAAGRRANLQASVEIGETYSEVRGSSNASRNGADWVTRVSPGLRLNWSSGTSQASLAYSLSATHHSNDEIAGREPGRAVRQSMDARWSDAWWQGRLALDAVATITQQPRSAFERRAAGDSTLADANLVEVGSVRVSPRWRSRIGDWAVAEVSLTAAGTNGRDSTATDSTTFGADARLASPTRGIGLGWALELSHQQVDQRLTRETTSDRAALVANWRPDPDLELRVNGGQERTDVGGLEKRAYDNWGFGLRWTPSRRTDVSLAGERRHFGDGWRVALQHRTPRTVWRLSSSRDTSDGRRPGGSSRPVSAFELLFEQFASRFPDPGEREQQVREFLRLLGIPADALVQSDAATGAISVIERHDVSAAWTGRRTSLTVAAFASDSRTLDRVVANPADVGRVQVWGWNASLGWRLTPDWTVTLLGSRQLTQGNDLNPGSELKSLTATLTGRLWRSATLGLNGRYSVFNSPRDPYRESALGATLGLRF